MESIDTIMCQVVEGTQQSLLCSDSGNGVEQTILITWLMHVMEMEMLHLPHHVCYEGSFRFHYKYMWACAMF
jgi:hypothetical protein